MVNLPLNLRIPASHELLQNDAKTDINAPEAVDADGGAEQTEEQMMSLDVWGHEPKMLLSGDSERGSSERSANFDSQESATSIFQLARGNK
jgi:hypothetical protein